MSFFSNIFQSGHQPSSPVYLNPFAEFDPRWAACEQEYEDSQARRQAKIQSVANWWGEQMNALADKHAESVTDALAGHPSKNPILLGMAVAEHNSALEIAHGVLLRQSDTRWGEKTTDDALKSLGHNALDLRLNAR